MAATSWTKALRSPWTTPHFRLRPNAPSITNPATDPQVTPNVVIGGLTSGGIGQAGQHSRDGW